MDQINEIIKGYQNYSQDSEGSERIRLAYEIARDAHAGQFRKSGEPYIVHPLSVANILVQLKMDSSCIAAALLHDTLEDTDIKINYLVEQLGKEVAGMVDALTKIKTNALAQKLQKEHARAETMRKIIFGMARNVRVIIVKLADRWNNIQTLNFLPVHKQKLIARETMTIYAPIADRLGLSIIRRDLLDKSFSYLDPKNYQIYHRRLAVSKSFLEKDVQKITSKAQELLERHNLRVRIYPRFKTPHSLYLRQKQGLPAHFLHIAIITSSSLACYQTLGLLHDAFNPLPGTTIKDYIAVPRTNGYQALHTYVLYNENVYPIQIRSEKMEQTARYGVLQTGQESSRSRYRGWIKHLKQWVQDESNARNILRGIEALAAQDRIYVCTPQGDYLGFPRGAIVLDFAYRIHTDIGHHCQGALINERPAGIFEELQDGTMVEIIHTDELQIQPSWLEHVRTPRARSAIRNWVEQRKRIRSQEFGHQLLRLAFERVKLQFSDIEKSQQFTDQLKDLGTVSNEDLFYKLGRGIITLKSALKTFMTPEQFKRYQKGGMTQLSRILNFVFNRNQGLEVFEIKNIHDPYLKYSLCCNPMPGEDIVGILSIQHGLSVHRIDCMQLKTHQLDEERLIKLAWGMNTLKQTPMRITVECQKRPKLAADILSELESHDVPISKFEMIPENNRFQLIIDMISSSADYANRILLLIKNHKGVIRVSRSRQHHNEGTK